MLVSQFVLSHAGHVEQAITVSRPRVDANHDGVDAAFHFSQAISVSTWNVKEIICGVDFSSSKLLEVKRRVHAIVVRIDPRTTNGDSLLHMACMRKNKLRDHLKSS